MIGALPRSRVALRRIADDVKRRLVDRDLDPAKVVGVLQKRRVFPEQVHQSLDRAGRLMLIKAQLEMHPHDGEIAAGG